jgi:hypothetical protein
MINHANLWLLIVAISLSGWGAAIALLGIAFGRRLSESDRAQLQFYRDCHLQDHAARYLQDAELRAAEHAEDLDDTEFFRALDREQAFDRQDQPADQEFCVLDACPTCEAELAGTQACGTSNRTCRLHEDSD